MGVKIRKRGGVWWLVIDHKGQRVSRSLRTSDKGLAGQLRTEAERRLASGDLSLIGGPGSPGEDPTLQEYAKRWLEEYARVELKASTYRSYEQLLRIHIYPRFGSQTLAAVKREDVKRFLAEMAGAGILSRNTLRLIACSLRTVMSAALEDGLVDVNPALKIGKFTRTEKAAHQAQAMTREEAQRFLESAREVCPGYYPLFFAALRTGLRKGELIALQWGDVQFGESPEDPNRYILVQRNWSHGRFTSPKNKKSRRVDLSQALRGILLELRDLRMFKAMQSGRASIADELIFPSESGGTIFPDNIGPRYMLPALEQAGLRKFRFHDLRHTFGSLLIQDGASLAYVKEQMGHSSIQITVDVYGHLIPGANVSWIDRLDAQVGATNPQHSGAGTPVSPVSDRKDWLPPRDSNPDMLIQSQFASVDYIEFKGFNSSESVKTRQGAQQIRNKNREDP